VPDSLLELGVRHFRLHDISVVFTIYFLAATCFGHTTIFKWKYIYIYIYPMEINPTDNGSIVFRIFVILVDYGDRCVPSDGPYGMLWYVFILTA
jgi:hypothetical protein